MMKKGIRSLAIVVILSVMPTCTQSQIHPSKQAYADWESWPVTTPDQVDLSDSFRPFRAVWSREYRNMNGEMRSDHIVLVAEELSWYGRPVISLTYHDVGALDSPDTNARTVNVYVDRRNLTLVRATGPKVGTAEDYNVVAAGEGAIVTTTVSTATGSAETSEFATDSPVFGSFSVDFLIWAGLSLGPDTRAVTHLYSPSANGMVPSIIRVVGSEEVELPDGERARAWVVERPTNQPENARMHHFRILDRPP